MKANDLLDYKIMIVTSGAAFKIYYKLNDKEFVGKNYHKYLEWVGIEASTKDMVANIATILYWGCDSFSDYQDKNFSHAYLKYAN